MTRRMLTAEELAVIFAQERYVLRGREVDAALAAFDAVHGGNYDTVHDLSPRAAFERALTGASGHTDHLTAAVKHMAANETSTALARADAVVHAAKALDRAYDAAADAKTDDDHADSTAEVSRRATDLSAALAAYDGPAARDCAKLGHRYATRQTTGEETCIDCFGVEPASEAKWRPIRDLELESTKDALTETLKSRAEARAALAASEAARAEAERKMEAWSKWATAPRAEAAVEIARLTAALATAEERYLVRLGADLQAVRDSANARVERADSKREEMVAFTKKFTGNLNAAEADREHYRDRAVVAETARDEALGKLAVVVHGLAEAARYIDPNEDPTGLLAREMAHRCHVALHASASLIAEHRERIERGAAVMAVRASRRWLLARAVGAAIGPATAAPEWLDWYATAIESGAEPIPGKAQVDRG